MKVDVILHNAHKSLVSANVFCVESEATGTMCDFLDIPRGTFYYKPIEKPLEDGLTKEITTIFITNRNNYDTRKKIELEKKNRIVSRRRIGRIME